MTDAEHARTIVVWDQPSTIVCGRPFVVKVGIKCSGACAPDDWAIEVLDHEQLCLAQAVVGAQPWPETTGLYYTDVELLAPASPGLFRFTAIAPAQPPMQAGAPRPEAAAAPGESERDAPPPAAHSAARADFNVRSVAEPEHRLTVLAIDRDSQSPVAGLRVVAHPYRTTTDRAGQAELHLPRGKYRVFVSGRDYIPFRSEGELAGDLTLRAELEHDRPLTDAERWS